MAVGAVMLLASAYGFSQTEAKVNTGDYFFTGFPSYWNIVALYLYVWRLSPVVTALLLLVLAILVFVPIRYIYPSRTVVLRRTTLTLGVIWGALMVWTLWELPHPTGPWLDVSLIFPIYYTALSIWLHFASPASSK